MRVLDENLCEAPVGEPGELYLSGPGLARGYVNRPALTADRFVPDPDPDRSGARMYRTGDLARRRPDGRLDFLGRTDRQIKLRGFRIEPGEIEVALRCHPTIADAYVMLHQNPAGGRLVAYVVPAGVRRWTSAAELRRHLADRLPEYLRPSAYVALERMPLTVSGKVDVNALPAPPRAALRAPGEEPVAPRGPLEREVAEIWRQVLCVDELGVHDDFFELGGYSLLAVQIADRLRAVLGRAVPVGLIFDHPTVARLAARLTQQPSQSGDVTGWRRGDATRNPLSLLQEEVWFLARLSPKSVAYNTQTTLRVRGPLDLDVFDAALTEQARRHHILRTTFEEDEDGQAWQVLHDPAPVHADRVDLRHLPTAEQEQRMRELVAERSALPFDLGRLPLCRSTAGPPADWPRRSTNSS